MFHVVFWFIKQLYYILRRFTKYKILLLACVGLFVYFLLTNTVFGYESYNITIDNTQYTIQDANQVVLDTINTLPEKTSGDYVYFTRVHTSGNYDVYFFPKADLSNFRIYVSNLNYSVGGTRAFRYQFSNDIMGFTIIGYSIDPNTGSYTRGTGTASSSWYTFTLKPNNVITLSSNYDIYYGATGDFLIYDYLTVNPQQPFIVNSSDIPSWGFERLLINGYNLVLNDSVASYTYQLKVAYDITQTFYIPINSYALYDETVTPRLLYFSIPRNVISSYITLAPNKTIVFWLVRNSNYPDLNAQYSLGTYTLSSLSQADADNINTITEQEVSATDSQNLQDIASSLNNSDVDFSLTDLPQDSSEDITRDGINNIFTSIYNAFCTGSAQDINLTIPFTNTNLTIPANLTRNVLETMHANIIINIIEALWWYLISRFIIKDILNKITKIKSGNIEHLQDDNIKGDML